MTLVCIKKSDGKRDGVQKPLERHLNLFSFTGGFQLVVRRRTGQHSAVTVLAQDNHVVGDVPQGRRPHSQPEAAVGHPGTGAGLVH